MLSPVISKIVVNTMLIGATKPCFHNMFHLTSKKIPGPTVSGFIKRFTTHRKTWPLIVYTDTRNKRNSSESGFIYETVPGLRKHQICSSGYCAKKPAVLLKNQPPRFANTSISERLIFTGKNQDCSIKGHSPSNSDANTQANLTNLSNITNQKHENVITVPNLLCLSRILAAPYLSYVIINDGDFSWALAIFMYAGLTDAVR